MKTTEKTRKQMMADLENEIHRDFEALKEATDKELNKINDEYCRAVERRSVAIDEFLRSTERKCKELVHDISFSA